MLKSNRYTIGFALPTVLISSVVMLTIMAISVSSVASVRVTLKEQYYEQLAKEAGEAGVAYAKACLARNSNVPQWTEAKPLTPATDCLGNNLSGSPSNYLVSQDEMRSSFRVGLPTLGSDGRAVSIPHTGFVELLRKSEGTPWRTYTQPAVQAAVVPDLCSGAATSALGWRNAYVPSNQNLLLTGAGSSARSIVAANPQAQSGYAYFRKDFYVPETGSYRVSARTNNAQTDRQLADVYVDGDNILRGVDGSQSNSSNISLSQGCHTVTIRMNNRTLIPYDSRIVAAVYKNGATSPIAATDSTWRVNTGELRHFSESNYNASSSYAWVPAIDDGVLSEWTAASGTTGNSTARLLRPPYGYSGGSSGNSPASSYFHFRAGSDFVVGGSSNANVKLSTICGDDCDVFIDGVKYVESVPWPKVSVTEVTLTPGKHRVGVILYNSGTTPNPSGFSLAIMQGSTKLIETNNSWVSANTAQSTPVDWVSYDRFHEPSPSEVPIDNPDTMLMAINNSSSVRFIIDSSVPPYSNFHGWDIFTCYDSPACVPSMSTQWASNDIMPNPLDFIPSTRGVTYNFVLIGHLDQTWTGGYTSNIYSLYVP